MAQRDREHDSMKFHPKQPAAKKWVYSPTEGKKCLPMKQAKDLIASGEWFATPADFPTNVERKEALDAQAKEALAKQQARNAERAKASSKRKAEEAIRLMKEAEEDAAKAEALGAEVDDLEEDLASQAEQAGLTGALVEDPDVDPDADQEDEDEDDKSITLPNEAIDWSKAQLEEFVVSNELAKGLDLRNSKAKLFDEVIALIQDYNANLA